MAEHSADRRHDNTKHNGRGKAPGIRRWGERAVFEGPRTSAADLADWQKCERKWPGTGIACGDIIAIDADFAVDPQVGEQAQAIAFEVFGETRSSVRGRLRRSPWSIVQPKQSRASI